MSPTLPLRTTDNWRTTQPIDIKGRWVGAIATYQALASMPDMFLAHATDPGHRTLVIFDEVPESRHTETPVKGQCGKALP